MLSLKIGCGNINENKQSSEEIRTSFVMILANELSCLFKRKMNFTFKGPCNVKYMPVIVQQDATIYSLFVSVNRSTYFGWYVHPSSGAHVTLSTASGIGKIVTATCRESDWTETVVPVQSRSRQVAVTVLLMSDSVDRVT